MKAVDPDGVTWRVSRRWLPRYEGRGLRERLRQRRARRIRNNGDRDPRWFDGMSIVFLQEVLLLLSVIGTIVVFVLIGIPALLALVDLVIVLIVGMAGVVARVAFRRPWTVEALGGDGRVIEVPVVGWRAAGDEIGRLAERIRAGRADEAPTERAARLSRAASRVRNRR